jgi:hypothetical protein
MKNTSAFLALLLVGMTSLSNAYAQSCKAPKAGPELSADEMSELYNCIQPGLVKAYAKKSHEVGSVYGDWKAASLRPASPGVHSGQYLMTYVNDVGYDQYVKYSNDGTQLPVGTIIAKENFTIKDSGKISKGPLLIMTKVGDEAADTGGWVYTGVKANGKNLKVDGKGFCHACHQAYPTQDFLGYPVQDVRVTSN